MRNLAVRLGAWTYLVLGVGLFIIGVLSLNHIVNNWWPFDVERLDLVRATALSRADAASILEAANTDIIFAFLGGVVIAVTGLALPLAYVVDKRFGLGIDVASNPLNPIRFMATLRQAMWVGIWIAFCTWLQMNRTFGIAVAGLAATVLILFEALLQVRGRADRANSETAVAGSE